MKRFYNFLINNRGLTLVEVLAAVAIASILIGLITSVLLSTLKQNNMTQSHNAIRQEANYTVTKLRNTHKDHTYTICYADDKKIYLDATKSNLLANSKFTFSEVMIENVGIGKIDRTNQCIDLVDVEEPLQVQFTLEDESGNNFSIDTVIQRLKPINSHN